MKTIKNKKWNILFLLVFIVGAITVMGITIVVDPYFQYHKPLDEFPYIVDHQINMNPGLARNMEYDSILLGSSMTVSFQKDWFENYLGLNVQKLSYNGAFPKDQANIMKLVFQEKEDLKTVFLGIDENTYSANVEETKFPITEYLYDNYVWNDLPYLLNKNILLSYILRALADPKDATDWNMIYQPWWQDEHYQKALVLMTYQAAEVSETETDKEAFVQGAKENLEINILPYIEEHPETEFVIFYPPYSILYWNDVINRKELEAVLCKYEYITSRLLAYENVKVFFFQNQESIICDLNNYADYTHYHKRICEYMVQCFTNGEREVTMDTLEEELERLRKLALTYDYEKIYDNWYE